MVSWTLRFDATVSVEADDDARNEAQDFASTRVEEYLRGKLGGELSVSDIYAVKMEILPGEESIQGHARVNIRAYNGMVKLWVDLTPHPDGQG